MPSGRWIAACALAALTCMCVAAGSASAAAPQVRVEGKRLIDARNGRAFVPRGVNWPSFEYACFYGYGYSDAADPISTHPTPASAAMIASWHVNTVRVPLNQACWLGDDGQPAFGTVAGYRAAVQDWVSLLHDAGLVVILDLHWSAPSGTPAEGQRAMPDARSDEFWTSVATTFKNDRSMIFDVFNEPYSRYDDSDRLVFDLGWECWRNGGCAAPRANDNQPVDGTTFTVLGMQALVDAVRGTGASQPIMVAGLDYANDLSGWLENRPVDDQLVASFHNYHTQTCHTVACWNETIAPIAAKVPVVTGEFGQTDCGDSHLTSFMNWADRRGVGYLAWAWWVLPDKSCSTLSLLANVDGTPQAPNGTALKAHLAALAGPRFSLGGPAKQDLDRAVEVRVRCKGSCRARATGKLVLSTRPRRTFRLSTVSRAVRAGRTSTLALKVSRKARRAAASALRARRTVTVALTVRVTDASGKSSSRKRKVRLR